MDDTEVLKIYSDKVKRLEVTIDNLEGENANLTDELHDEYDKRHKLEAINAELVGACKASICAIVEPRIDWATLKGEIAYEKMVSAIAKAEAMP